jgi:hypothetical protein
MIDTLTEIARAARVILYRISAASFHGLDVDIVLHFGLGALIFAVAERRLGPRRAGFLLGGLILAKEVADLFLKSRLRYITSPDLPVVMDIVTDIATGVAGGVAVFLLRRHRRKRHEVRVA